MTLDTQSTVTDLSPQQFRNMREDKDVLLVDVREDYEHAAERIDGAVNRPLSKFDPKAISEEAGDRDVVFHCRSGSRSSKAADRYTQIGESAYNLSGGIEGWKQAGQPVQRSASAPKLDIMRQVQLTIGLLTILGTALGVFVSPWFLILPAFLGCGLTFAGATGWCGLALLLGKMPWNKAADCGASCAA